MVGSSIYRLLVTMGYKNLITISKKNLDLTNQDKVLKFFKKNKPDAVIIAAAKVGGILANDSLRASFLYENLAIQNNLINSSFPTIKFC